MAPVIQVKIRQVGPTTGQGSVRAHSVLVDRPVEKGGSDQGPMGGELMLIGLGGCFLSNILAAARERGASVTDVRIDVSARAAGIPPRYTDIEMRVVSEEVSPDVLGELIGAAERGCIATGTLRAGAPVTVVQEGAPATNP